MNASKSRYFLGFAIAWILLSPPSFGLNRPTEIDSIEVYSSGGYEYVNIKTDNWAPPAVNYDQASQKIILTFYNSRASSPLPVSPSPASVISAIDVSGVVAEPPYVQVVINLKGRIKYDVANMIGKNLTIVEMKQVEESPPEERTVVAKISNATKEAEKPKERERVTVKVEEIYSAPQRVLPDLVGEKGFRTIVDGHEFKMGGYPAFSGAVLMVPASDFFENLGAQASILRDGVLSVRIGDEKKIEVDVREKTVKVNGGRIGLAAPPFSEKRLGRTIFYIPLTDAAGIVDYGVSWDGKNRVVVVNPKLVSISSRGDDRTYFIDLSFSDTVDKQRFTVLAGGPRITIEAKDVFMSPDLKDGISIGRGDVEKALVEEVNPGKTKIMLVLRSQRPFRASYSGEEKRFSLCFAPAIISIIASREAGYTKIEVASSGPMTFEASTQERAGGISLTFPGMILFAQPKIDAAGGAVAGANASQATIDPPSVKVSVALLEKASIKTFVSADKKKVSLLIVQPKKVIAKAEKKDHSVLKDKVIVIDPGHGGRDPGTIGYSGTYEKNANLAQSLELARALVKAGATVLLTRDSDVSVHMRDVVRFATDNRADIFIAVHYNSFMSPYVRGIETYYYTPESRLLARIVHKNLVRGIKRKNRGIKREMYYAIHHSTMPAILVEPGYITNRTEEKLAFSAPFQKEVASDILKGVAEYFTMLKKYRK